MMTIFWGMGRVNCTENAPTRPANFRVNRRRHISPLTHVDTSQRLSTDNRPSPGRLRLAAHTLRLGRSSLMFLFSTN
jgi:hypothetical protein